MTELFETHLSRREAVSAFAVVAAGAALGLGLRPERALATARMRAGSTTTISSWFELPEDEKQMSALIALFHKMHPTLNVDMTYKPAGVFAQALKVALVGGTAPDSIQFQTGAQLQQSVAAGQVEPIDQYVAASSLTPIARDVLEFGGHLWGVPLYEVSIGIAYQRPIFKQFNLTPPKSWADLMTINKTLQSNLPSGVTPWAMPASDMILPFFFYNMACNSILGPAGLTALAKGHRKLTDSDLLPAAQLMIDYEPYYESGYRATSYPNGKGLFAEGRAAMIVAGNSDFAGYLDTNSKADIGFMAFPSPSGKTQITASGLEGLYTINKSSPNASAAGQWVKFLASAPAQELIAALLGIPIRKGVVVKGNSPSEQLIREIHEAQNPDTLNWAAVAALGPMFTAVAGLSGVFTGSLTAEQFAAKMQSAIKP